MLPAIDGKTAKKPRTPSTPLKSASFVVADDEPHRRHAATARRAVSEGSGLARADMSVSMPFSLPDVPTTHPTPSTTNARRQQQPGGASTARRAYSSGRAAPPAANDPMRRGELPPPVKLKPWASRPHTQQSTLHLTPGATRSNGAWVDLEGSRPTPSTAYLPGCHTGADSRALTTTSATTSLRSPPAVSSPNRTGFSPAPPKPLVEIPTVSRITDADIVKTLAELTAAGGSSSYELCPASFYMRWPRMFVPDVVDTLGARSPSPEAVCRASSRHLPRHLQPPPAPSPKKSGGSKRRHVARKPASDIDGNNVIAAHLQVRSRTASDTERFFVAVEDARRGVVSIVPVDTGAECAADCSRVVIYTSGGAIAVPKTDPRASVAGLAQWRLQSTTVKDKVEGDVRLRPAFAILPLASPYPMAMRADGRVAGVAEGSPMPAFFIIKGRDSIAAARRCASVASILPDSATVELVPRGYPEHRVVLVPPPADEVHQRASARKAAKPAPPTSPPLSAASQRRPASSRASSARSSRFSMTPGGKGANGTAAVVAVADIEEPTQGQLTVRTTPDGAAVFHARVHSSSGAAPGAAESTTTITLRDYFGESEWVLEPCEDGRHFSLVPLDALRCGEKLELLVPPSVHTDGSAAAQVTQALVESVLVTEFEALSPSDAAQLGATRKDTRARLDAAAEIVALSNEAPRHGGEHESNPLNSDGGARGIHLVCSGLGAASTPGASLPRGLVCRVLGPGAPAADDDDDTDAVPSSHHHAQWAVEPSDCLVAPSGAADGDAFVVHATEHPDGGPGTLRLSALVEDEHGEPFELVLVAAADGSGKQATAMLSTDVDNDPALLWRTAWWAKPETAVAAADDGADGGPACPPRRFVFGVTAPSPPTAARGSGDIFTSPSPRRPSDPDSHGVEAGFRHGHHGAGASCRHRDIVLASNGRCYWDDAATGASAVAGSTGPELDGTIPPTALAIVSSKDLRDIRSGAARLDGAADATAGAVDGDDDRRDGGGLLAPIPASVLDGLELLDGSPQEESRAETVELCDPTSKNFTTVLVCLDPTAALGDGECVPVLHRERHAAATSGGGNPAGQQWIIERIPAEEEAPHADDTPTLFRLRVADDNNGDAEATKLCLAVASGQTPRHHRSDDDVPIAVCDAFASGDAAQHWVILRRRAHAASSDGAPLLYYFVPRLCPRYALTPAGTLAPLVVVVVDADGHSGDQDGNPRHSHPGVVLVPSAAAEAAAASRALHQVAGAALKARLAGRSALLAAIASATGTAEGGVVSFVVHDDKTSDLSSPPDNQVPDADGTAADMEEPAADTAAEATGDDSTTPAGDETDAPPPPPETTEHAPSPAVAPEPTADANDHAVALLCDQVAGIDTERSATARDLADFSNDDGRFTCEWSAMEVEMPLAAADPDAAAVDDADHGWVRLVARGADGGTLGYLGFLVNGELKVLDPRRHRNDLSAQWAVKSDTAGGDEVPPQHRRFRFTPRSRYGSQEAGTGVVAAALSRAGIVEREADETCTEWRVTSPKFAAVAPSSQPSEQPASPSKKKKQPVLTVAETTQRDVAMLVFPDTTERTPYELVPGAADAPARLGLAAHDQQLSKIADRATARVGSFVARHLKDGCVALLCPTSFSTGPLQEGPEDNAPTAVALCADISTSAVAAAELPRTAGDDDAPVDVPDAFAWRVQRAPVDAALADGDEAYGLTRFVLRPRCGTTAESSSAAANVTGLTFEGHVDSANPPRTLVALTEDAARQVALATHRRLRMRAALPKTALVSAKRPDPNPVLLRRDGTAECLTVSHEDDDDDDAVALKPIPSDGDDTAEKRSRRAWRVAPDPVTGAIELLLPSSSSPNGDDTAAQHRKLCLRPRPSAADASASTVDADGTDTHDAKNDDAHQQDSAVLMDLIATSCTDDGDVATFELVPTPTDNTAAKKNGSFALVTAVPSPDGRRYAIAPSSADGGPITVVPVDVSGAVDSLPEGVCVFTAADAAKLAAAQSQRFAAIDGALKEESAARAVVDDDEEKARFAFQDAAYADRDAAREAAEARERREQEAAAQDELVRQRIAERHAAVDEEQAARDDDVEAAEASERATLKADESTALEAAKAATMARVQKEDRAAAETEETAARDILSSELDNAVDALLDADTAGQADAEERRQRREEDDAAADEMSREHLQQRRAVESDDEQPARNGIEQEQSKVWDALIAEHTDAASARREAEHTAQREAAVAAEDEARSRDVTSPCDAEFMWFGVEAEELHARAHLDHIASIEEFDPIVVAAKEEHAALVRAAADDAERALYDAQKQERDAFEADETSARADECEGPHDFEARALQVQIDELNARCRLDDEEDAGRHAIESAEQDAADAELAAAARDRVDATLKVIGRNADEDAHLADEEHEDAAAKDNHGASTAPFELVPAAEEGAAARGLRVTIDIATAEAASKAELDETASTVSCPLYIDRRFYRKAPPSVNSSHAASPALPALQPPSAADDPDAPEPVIQGFTFRLTPEGFVSISPLGYPDLFLTVPDTDVFDDADDGDDQLAGLMALAKVHMTIEAAFTAASRKDRQLFEITPQPESTDTIGGSRLLFTLGPKCYPELLVEALLPEGPDHDDDADHGDDGAAEEVPPRPPLNPHERGLRLIPANDATNFCEFVVLRKSICDKAAEDARQEAMAADAIADCQLEEMRLAKQMMDEEQFAWDELSTHVRSLLVSITERNNIRRVLAEYLFGELHTDEDEDLTAFEFAPASAELLNANQLRITAQHARPGKPVRLPRTRRGSSFVGSPSEGNFAGDASPEEKGLMRRESSAGMLTPEDGGIPAVPGQVRERVHECLTQAFVIVAGTDGYVSILVASDRRVALGVDAECTRAHFLRFDPEDPKQQFEVAPAVDVAANNESIANAMASSFVEPAAAATAPPTTPKHKLAVDEMRSELAWSAQQPHDKSTSAVGASVMLDDTVFTIRPRVSTNLVVELNMDDADDVAAVREHKIFRLVKARQSSSFSALRVLRKADCDADYERERDRVQVATERRRDAVFEIFGDLDEMPIVEIAPLASDDFRWRFIKDTPDVAQVVPGDRSLGDAQRFAITDAGDGYINVVPWQATDRALAAAKVMSPPATVTPHQAGEGGDLSVRVPNAVPTFRVSFADADNTDDAQAFEVVPVGGDGANMSPMFASPRALSTSIAPDDPDAPKKASSFALVPKGSSDLYIEANMDSDGQLTVVGGLNSFCAFKAFGANSPAASMEGSPRSDAARVARYKAVQTLIGDLTEMKTFQVVAVLGRDVVSDKLLPADAGLADVCLSVALASDAETADTERPVLLVPRGGEVEQPADADADADDTNARRMVGTSPESQQFIFGMAADGYVTVMPISDPQTSLHVADDGSKVTLGETVEDTIAQQFELVRLEGHEQVFSLCPRLHDIGVMQCANVAPSAIDGKSGASEEAELQAALRVVPGSEITNACYFRLVEITGTVPLAGAAAGGRRKKKKKDRAPERIAELRRIFGDAFIPAAHDDGVDGDDDETMKESIVSVAIEIAPAAAHTLRLTDSGGAVPIKPRVPKGREQVFTMRHVGEGLVVINPTSDAEAALTVDSEEKVGVFAAEPDAKEQRFEVLQTVELDDESVARFGGDAAGWVGEKRAFVLSCYAHPKTVLEATMDTDQPELRNIPLSDLTNFCEFVVVDHATMLKDEEELERARKERKQRKARRQAAVKVIGDLDAMEVFELVPSAFDKARVLAQGDGKRFVAAPRNGQDTQQLVFTESDDGYVNIVTWSSSTSVFTAADSAVVVQAPLIQPDESPTLTVDIDGTPTAYTLASQNWEFVLFEDGAFALSPQGHPGKYVEIALEEADGDQVLRLVPETEASNFSSFRLVKPADVSPAVSPEAKKPPPPTPPPQEDPMVVARRNDIVKAMGRDNWAGMKIHLTSGTERAMHVAVDPKSNDFSIVFASEDRAPKTTFTVRDATEGYIALAVDDGEDGTYWAPNEDGKGCVAGAASQPFDAALEVVLLEGAEGFCLAPLAFAGKVLEVQFNEPAPHPIGLVAEDEISTFSEFLREDVE